MAKKTTITLKSGTTLTPQKDGSFKGSNGKVYQKTESGTYKVDNQATHNQAPPGTQFSAGGVNFTKNSDGSYSGSNGRTYDYSNGKYTAQPETTQQSDTRHQNEPVGTTHNCGDNTMTKNPDGTYTDSFGGTFYFYNGVYNNHPEGQQASVSAGTSLNPDFNAGGDLYTTQGMGAGYYTTRLDKYGVKVVIPSSGKATDTADYLSQNFNKADLQAQADSNGNIPVVVVTPDGREVKQTLNINNIFNTPTDYSTPTPPPTGPSPQPYTYIPSTTPPSPPPPDTTPPSPSPYIPVVTQQTVENQDSVSTSVSKVVTDVKKVDNVSTSISNEVIGWNLPAMDEIIARFKEISKNFANAEVECKALIPKINEAWSSTYGSVAYDAKLKDGMLKHFAEGADAMDKICGVLEMVEKIYKEFEQKVLAGTYTGDYSEIGDFAVKYSGKAYNNNIENVLEHKQIIDTTTTTTTTEGGKTVYTYRDGVLVDSSVQGAGGTSTSSKTDTQTVNMAIASPKTGLNPAVAYKDVYADKNAKSVYDSLMKNGLSAAHAYEAAKGYMAAVAKAGDGKSVYTMDYVHMENNKKVTKTFRYLTDKKKDTVELLNVTSKDDVVTTINTKTTKSNGGTSVKTSSGSETTRTAQLVVPSNTKINSTNLTNTALKSVSPELTKASYEKYYVHDSNGGTSIAYQKIAPTSYVGTNVNGSDTSNVKIMYSTDGGSTNYVTGSNSYVTSSAPSLAPDTLVAQNANGSNTSVAQVMTSNNDGSYTVQQGQNSDVAQSSASLGVNTNAATQSQSPNIATGSGTAITGKISSSDVVATAKQLLKSSPMAKMLNMNKTTSSALDAMLNVLFKR